MAFDWSLVSMIVWLGVACLTLMLAVWLATSKRAQGPAVSSSATALFLAALSAIAATVPGQGSLLAGVTIVASNFAWLLLLYRLFGHDGRDRSTAPIRPVVIVLTLVEALQIVLLVALQNYGGVAAFSAAVAHFSISFRLLFCIGALVLVHNLYAGASAGARQVLRWPSAALGVLWLYDLNLYTVAYLTNGAPSMLLGLRIVALAAAAFLLALGMLKTKSELRFRPSRTMAFQSFSLLLIGAYLVVMIVIAQALSYVGSDLGRVLQIGFVLLASVVALTVLPSRRLRSWLRVTVSKNLFQHRYDYRSEWLRFTDTIGRAGADAPPLLQRAVQAVADITDSPRGLLLTPREDGALALAAHWRWPDIAVPADAIDHEGARFFEGSQFIVDLDVLRRGLEDGVPHAAVPVWLRDAEESWAIVPLVHYDRLLGVVVLARPPVARELDWEDFDVLRVVGRQLASYLAESASQDALSEAQRFEEFNRRMAFVMHDIKNLTSQLSLLARNAEKHADKAEFRADMILTLRSSTDKLQSLLARLNRYGSQPSETREPVDIEALLRRIARSYRGKHPVQHLPGPAAIVTTDAEGLEQAIIHLVQNAVDASHGKTPVELTASHAHGSLHIAIVDAGPGMSPDFVRNELFKPFHSTKASGFGIGAFEARELVRGLGGQLEVDSRPGVGTRFVIQLPCDNTADVTCGVQIAEPIREVA